MPRRLACLVLAAAAIGVAVPASAGAHAFVVRTQPSDGSRLTSPPRVIRIWFSEDISPRFRSALLVDAAGNAVHGVRVRGQGNELELVVPRVGRGAYGVAWHVLSENDGHATGGGLSFGVGVVPAARMRSAQPAPPAVDVALRWLRFSFTALLLGGLAFVTLVLAFARPWLEPQLVGRAGRRALAVSAAGGAGALGVALATLIRQTNAVDPGTGSAWLSTVQDLVLTTRWGGLWLAGVALVALLSALAVALRDRAPNVSTPAAAVAALAAASLAGVDALGSHAAALPHARLAVAADGVHVLAVSLWLGALVALAVGLAPVRGLRRVDAHTLAITVRRPFAALAGGALLIAVVTGLYSAGVQVASVDALLTTLYGRALLVKIALVSLCCALGATNFHVLRRLDRRRVVRMTIAAEALVGLGALVGAAVLTSSVPARGPQFDAPRAVRAPTLTAQAGDVVLSIAVRPNRPGVNFVTVIAASSRRPAPAPIGSVAVRAVGAPAGSALRQIDRDRWAGTVRLDAPGDSSLAVVVARGNERLGSSVRWRVDPADPARAVRVSSRRLSSFIDPALVLLLGAVAAAAAVALFLRWNRFLPRLAREEHA